jgi:hypothetical protein
MASQLSQSIAHDLFMDAGVNRKAKRLVLESEGDKYPGAGWGEKALADRVDLSLREVREVLEGLRVGRGHCWYDAKFPNIPACHADICQRARTLMQKLKC